jgi:CRISPR/Cas system CMR subunit Cmr6 (Cas7 group RAMP superfamily)
MNYDWFVEINDTYQCGLLKIAEHDKKIDNAKNDEKNKLKTERGKLWKDMWEQIAKGIPSYSSQIKLLTSMASEHESFLNILRERHVEIAFDEGKQIIKKNIKLASTDSLFGIFKEPKFGSIADYPIYSFFLQFTFSLTKPYLSKDDDQFYICENPIRKDKIFKVPMISGSTWKGNMRWTARQYKERNPDKSDTPEIIRLFGNERGKDSDFKRGRLNFYPTFFDQISLEVINPHDRKTKAGINPIYIESVPVGASGYFSLLYVPFDLIGKPLEIKKQVIEDMNLIYDALKEMMLTYGFSAKKGSGFGVADKNISGTLEMSGCPVYKNQADNMVKDSHPFSKLKELVRLEKVKETDFSGFEGLNELVNKVKEAIERGYVTETAG